jgi:hypothetical protein
MNISVPIRLYKFHSRVRMTVAILKADRFPRSVHYSGGCLGFGDVYYRHRLLSSCVTTPTQIQTRMAM